MKYNKKYFLSIFIIVILISLYIYSSFFGSKKLYRHINYDGFDTIIEINAYCRNEKESIKLFNLIDEKINHYTRLYDIYRNYDGINNIKTINDNAGIQPVEVDDDIVGLIDFSKKMYSDTNGCVNIALGPVLKIWHDKREEGIKNPEKASLPDMEDLKDAHLYTDINKIVVDGNSVYIEEGMRIDVGAVAKGYACEKTAQYLIENNYDNILLSFGGNIRVIGDKFNAEGKRVPFKIGIRDPKDENNQKAIRTVSMSSGSLVTSGSYERYYIVDNKKYHHIISPVTLFPSGEEIDSVSVYAQDSGIADAYSTALYNMSIDEGMNFINSRENVYALWIKKDGSILYSDGFDKMFVD